MRDGRSPTDGTSISLPRENAGHHGIAKHLLDVLGVENRSAEADGNVIGEVIAADRDDAGVDDHSFEVHDEVGRSGADINQADAEFALVGLKHGIGAGKRFEDGIVHVNAGAIYSGDDVLRRGGARR